LIKPAPDARVVAWIRAADEDSLHLSVLTFAEIRHGIERLTPGARRDRLRHWLETDLTDRFEGRILDLDRATAEAWGVIMAQGAAKGVRFPTMDALIAATALRHGLVMVTRNLRDFRRVEIAVVDPWEPGAAPE
jgi:hypothetical protein